MPPQWIPNPVRFDAYKRLSELDTLFSGIKNTVIVSLSVTIIGTLTSSLAAFSFAKLRMPFKDVLFLLLLAALMIPYPAVMIPQFMMFSKIGWVDTLLPLIIPGMFGNITMIFFLRQYLSNIPDSIVEAAKSMAQDTYKHFSVNLSVDPSSNCCTIHSLVYGSLE